MLEWLDYAIFFAMLLISAGVGIYFGCFGSRQNTTNEYLQGGKTMGVVPIGISIAVSHFSGVTILAIPADTFRYGAFILYANAASIFVAFLSIFVYLPVFFKLQLNSTYEYLAQRFDNRTKLFALCLYILSEIIFFPLLVYIPALALSITSGLSVPLTSFVVCGFCIFYTTIGGLKTVVWTDAIQFFVIMVSVITITGLGVVKSGGFGTVWETALKGQRLDILDFDLNPTKRDTCWTILVGYGITMASSIIIHPTGVQKYLSVPKFQTCISSVIFSTVCKCLVCTFSVLMGLVIYSRYYDCDPLTAQKMQKHDHLVLYYLKDVAGNIPGISGLFVAAIFSAALSSMSSLLNSMSGVIFNDIVSKFLKKEYSELTKSNILKLIVIIVGILGTSLVFTVEYLGPLLALSMAVRGSVNGPLLGMFTAGMLFPKVNAKGAFYGGVIGLLSLVAYTVTVKSYEIRKMIIPVTKPISIEGCDNINSTLISFINTNITQISTSSEVPAMFKLSVYWYTLVGTAITITVALVISYITNKDDKPVHKDYISPCVYLFMRDKFRQTMYYNVECNEKLLSSKECDTKV